MKLTKNFHLDEFIYSRFFNEKYQAEVLKSFEADKDFLLPNIQKLANNLQVLRNELDEPIDINIAYRPKWWEALKGRTGLSKHALGMAADIVCDIASPKKVAETIERLISDGDMLQGGL